MRLWNRGNDDPARRFLVEDRATTLRARGWNWRAAIGQIIRNGLALMGVEAAEEMR